MFTYYNVLYSCMNTVSENEVKNRWYSAAIRSKHMKFNAGQKRRLATEEEEIWSRTTTRCESLRTFSRYTMQLNRLTFDRQVRIQDHLRKLLRHLQLLTTCR